VCPGELTPGNKFALAQLDPFHSSVLGAKIPDSNTQPSISSSDIEQISVTSSSTATHVNGVAFRPQYTWGVVYGTAGAAVDWGAGYAGSNRSKRTAYNNAIELTRPVAHAIRLSSPVAPTAASGFVHIAISTETTYGEVTWKFPTTVAEISGCQFYKRVTLASLTQSPLTVINKWIDDTAFRYSSPTSGQILSTAQGFQTDFSWGVIVVLYEGVPTSTAVLSAEHLLISEGIPQKDSPIIGTPAATSSPGLMSSTSDMQANTEPFHTEAEQDSYIQQGLNQFAQGAREQGEAVFQNVAVPLVRAAGRAVVSSAAETAYRMAFGIGGVNNNANRIAN